jgi:neutral amino acid transport system ATP-binding protein
MPAEETMTPAGGTPLDKGADGQSPATVTGVDISAARRALAEVPREPGAPKPDPIVVADGVKRQFGGLVAVDVDHLEVQRGSITALIGPNGAGKTSLFNLVTGFDRPDRGRWTFDGADLTGWGAARVASAGLVRTFQLTKVLGRMSVLDNMLVGAKGQRGEAMLAAPLGWLWREADRTSTARARQLLERFRLSDVEGDYAATLSGGQRKLLEMARALMAEPTVVMLDEPMAGVNPALVQSLLGHITNLRTQGMTVVFVEHDMDVVMGISDWVVCMAEGHVIAEGPPQSIVSNDEVIDAYLGTHRAARHRIDEVP